MNTKDQMKAKLLDDLFITCKVMDMSITMDEIWEHLNFIYSQYKLIETEYDTTLNTPKPL